ncbi:hypothetical protein EH183_42145 [Streptomyces sp. CB01881]|uniref:hypothetical protein n=1 Tax=Streptomyces sp. CB01881 TaxID=2078691 RepID=UPI0011DF05D3|nr:hypothetical protein [Streptomyces sp. CB01881]TYC66592.1 hypothetical protein EH183_42145 [Streptomyces sp. CB01881]
MNRYLADAPDGLSRRARYFVQVHGLRLESPGVAGYRSRWLELGIPESELDRAVAFEERWGGLVLPPAPMYDGGPRMLCPDVPQAQPSGGWWFEAGDQRTALPYSFMIGPRGEFGIHAERWVPLHASVEGWIESVALAHHAARCAKQITKVTGEDVDGIQLGLHEPVPEVEGLADGWWRGTDSLIAVHTGEAECFARPGYRTAVVYSGLDDWGLHG